MRRTNSKFVLYLGKDICIRCGNMAYKYIKYNFDGSIYTHYNHDKWVCYGDFP